MARFWRILLGVCGLLFLAAALFPMFQRVPENSFRPQSGCQSNMKQLGLALVQYAQDNDELLPEKASSGSSGWREAVYPFVKSTGVYRCPDDRRNGNQDAPTHLPKSYAANIACLSSGKKEATVFSLASSTVLVTDTRGYDGEDWDITNSAFLPSAGSELYTHKPSHYFYEHPLGTLNLLFADGHVKAMKPDATLEPLNLWTPNNIPFAGQDLTNARAILTHAEDQ